jgi:hypothetical protein
MTLARSLPWIAVLLLATVPNSHLMRVANAQAIDARLAAAATFLDRDRPDSERLKAAPGIGFPDAKTSDALLAIGADRSQSDAIRWEALHRHPFDQDWLDRVLAILDDANDGGEFLDWNLIEFLNRRATFKLPAEIRQRIQATWRKLLDDPRDRVRLSAYRVLAANHDPVAIARLSDPLRAQEPVPIPLHEAIELLDIDGSINHIGALRPYLESSDPAVQARAARALAVDPDSRPRIAALATDRRAPKEVRLHALRALAREDQRYGSYAIPLLESAREDGDIRYAAMHGFAGRMNYQRVDSNEQIRFAQAVGRIAIDRNVRSTSADKIRKEARELHAYLKMAFPEVQRFYAQ